MPSVLASKKVSGKIDDIYQLISDMPSYPRFMPDLLSVTLLSRELNKTTTHWISNVDGRKIEWTEEDLFYPQQYRIEYQQIKGDLKKFTGYWQLAETTEGVEISLFVDFEFGIPMIAGLLNPLLKKKVRENSENMLTAIEQELCK